MSQVFASVHCPPHTCQGCFRASSSSTMIGMREKSQICLGCGRRGSRSPQVHTTNNNCTTLGVGDVGIFFSSERIGGFSVARNSLLRFSSPPPPLLSPLSRRPVRSPPALIWRISLARIKNKQAPRSRSNKEKEKYPTFISPLFSSPFCGDNNSSGRASLLSSSPPPVSAPSVSDLDCGLVIRMYSSTVYHTC